MSNSFNTAQEFVDKLITPHIDNIINSWAKKEKILVKRIATVATYDGVAETATVYFPSDAINGSCSYPNKTGSTLLVGDTVYLFVEYGNVSQGWIMIKK